MNHHGEFRVNSGININVQITTKCKSQKKVSSLSKKISILLVFTRAKYVFLYLGIYRSSSKLGKEEKYLVGREHSELENFLQGKHRTV